MVTDASLQNKEIAMQKDLFRLAATIYSETREIVSEAEIQLQIIKCMFVSVENEYLTKSEIVSKTLEIYKYHISEAEVDGLISNSRNTFLVVEKDGYAAYCLTKAAQKECAEIQKNTIDSYIDAFVMERSIIDLEICKRAIHVYLYELTTTNINSYRVLLEGKDGTQFTSPELSVDVAELDEREKQYVYDFLAWDNPSKNVALGNLVYCCLEYCLLINGDSPNRLIKDFIKQREIYLDTNVIFRLLGINGESRKTVMLAFLKKCKQANLKIIITHATRKEFFDTIKFYIAQLEQYPRGKIYHGAFEEISDYNIFAFYENWHQEHPSVSLSYFLVYVKSIYINLVKEFSILDDERIPNSIFCSAEFREERDKYSTAIQHIKQGIKDSYLSDDFSYSQRDRHDATVVRYIELLRQERSIDKDIFMISSDKALRLWDMNRKEAKYPVVVYPSQLFLILLKTCGRSENDYDSFVSFINIRPSSTKVSPENANIIISGISSITEDIKTQKELVAAVFDDEFQNVIKHSHSDVELYKQVQRISQRYLDDKLKESKKTIEELQLNASKHEDERRTLCDVIENNNKIIQKKDIEIEQQENQLKVNRERLKSFVERKIMLQYIAMCYILPVSLAIFTAAIFFFIMGQFILEDKSWNLAVRFFEWVKSTYFGRFVGDFVYVIDVALVGFGGIVLRKWMKNPFDRNAKKSLKCTLMERYMKKNKIEMDI